ncbi:HepT-like ribonuclease domain-containing protein [Haliovirga abyssi]|uniref:DUF86 domain-containing protein n=1 Tax=Haliovirga abyssi TaxID=2996794 RepID=A0AAU9DYL1_9FUSO|nr:DUF86 domain-containing protein [Haliovirga abyssi]BDU51616.1 DUF86 domain-containing protein [Haliovirga abyssi]
MSKRNQIDLLMDIKEAIQRIIIYTKNIDIDEFYKDIKTQDAVTRNIEIIGEAAKMIDKKIMEMDNSIEWSMMAKTRDRLIHHYFGVNYDVVWAICKENLPEVLEKISKLIEK